MKRSINKKFNSNKHPRWAYRGEAITPSDFLQAIYQDLPLFFSKYASGRKIAEATIYLKFCDSSGEIVQITDNAGRPIQYIQGSKAYKSAADDYDRKYDEARLEQKIVSRHEIPFSPY